MHRNSENSEEKSEEKKEKEIKNTLEDDISHKVDVLMDN
jgi:hypothetical protein